MNTQDDYSDAIKQFGLIAQEYCSLVDSGISMDKAEFLRRLYRTLPQLITEGIRLPRVDFDGDEDELDWATLPANKIANSTYGQWSQLYNALKEKLGDWNLYWLTFDPRTDSEAIRASLADDIADIYRDLKRGLNQGDSSDFCAPREILFAWRSDFYSNWGRHAMNALRTIHFLLEDILDA